MKVPKSSYGAFIFAVIKSITDTVIKNNQNVFESLKHFAVKFRPNSPGKKGDAHGMMIMGPNIECRLTRARLSRGIMNIEVGLLR